MLFRSRKEILDQVVREIESLQAQAVISSGQNKEARTYSKKEFTNKPGQIILIDRPGISEAHVRMGFLGPSRKTEDYHNLEVAEAILSGPFNRRLNQNVREKQGLSYSVEAAFNYGDQFSTFVLTSSTRNEKLVELLQTIQKVLSDFSQSKDLTQEELNEAKSYIQGAFPLMLSNRYTIARMFFSSLLNDLPVRFLDDYRGRIGAVTLESLRSAINKHFHLDQMQIVVSGDAKTIGSQFKKARLPFRVRKISEYL